jgi:uncharacterized protein YegP (UPF0339 family)
MYFEIYDRLTVWGRRFYFRLRGANNEIVAHGEAYTSAAARDHGIELVRRSTMAPVVER